MKAVANTTDIPACWKPRSEHPELFYDGDQYLVAVLCGKSGDHSSYFWEYSVVRIRCDEDYFSVECNDESWGWEWNDVEYYIPLSQFKLPGIDMPKPAA